ncbi:Uu.00g139560.m01.CDS01 [Anthostomella pinea]|uniref:Uu.00g139560.m01.CDS01 n=1 Tax=Anthostomella pinea TaxID=933095 RepID=A0AAI8YLF5_9PEZI|nr:Uu.00g139560.m01.CDS01 [Anthostomella pinea]
MEQGSTPAGRTPPAPRAFSRASRACRRCRRLRAKCSNQGAPPCDGCRQANQECRFPQRGEPDFDRAYRNPTKAPGNTNTTVGNTAPSHASDYTRSDPGDSPMAAVTHGTAVSAPLMSLPSTPSQPRMGWEALPPFEEVLEGVHTLTTSYFQLGFLPKALFFEELRKDRASVSVFLLLSILSVSARFTPSLVRRYQATATHVFLSLASSHVHEQMFSPTLESIQGFFLLSIAEWGNMDKTKSSIYMGIAVRLAGILRLHREESYRLPETATKEQIVYSEVARRTFWVLETFENLHSGSDLPIAFSYGDITVLLPCDERDFTFGVRPIQRAALMGTPPAAEDPGLTWLGSRSLFAALLQTHSLWGQVARVVSTDAANLSSGIGSRLSIGEYGRLSQALRDFEDNLPSQHCWSVWNLRGFKAEGLDLAYLSTTMVLRLSNIILRRGYLHDILSTRQEGVPPAQSTGPSAWSEVAEQLFDNMLTLHEQIKAFFEYRSPDQGYPALIVFCVYVCGSLANNLRLQTKVCPRVAPEAQQVLHESIRGLGDLQSAWPLARRWHLALCKASESVVTESSRSSVEHGQGPLAESGGSMPAQVEFNPSEGISGLDVQFNNPFPSDNMYEVFEAYLWGDLANWRDGDMYNEPLIAPPFG